jgi:putative transposase
MEFITMHRELWPIVTLCSVLHVSESGYYKHERAKDKPYKYADILNHIYKLLKEDPENANYGVQRIWLYLCNNLKCLLSYSTVLRICHENNLMIKRKRRPKSLTIADAEAQKAENIINQNFEAEKPNEKWLTDITEIHCKDNKLYLAPILDCFDGSIRGFKMDINMKAELCDEAFRRACQKDNARCMIIHSDRGSQFTSHLFRDTLKEYGAIQSMSGTGRCYDNARMESFFATLKKELIYQMDTLKMTVTEVKSAIHRYIAYYNLRRIYTTNGGWPPLVYREMYYKAKSVA